MMNSIPTFSGFTSGQATRLLVTSLLGLVLAAGGAWSSAQAQDPPIAPTASSPQQVGNEFWVEVKVGSDEMPVQGLFGTSFALKYDETRLTITDDEAGGFLGDDVVYSSNVDEAGGEIGIGVSRKSGAGGVYGIGVLARVKVEVGSGVSGGTDLSFTLTEVEADDPNGNAIALDSKEFTVRISDTPPIRPTAASPQTPGNEFWVDVRVGNDAFSVSDLFGTSFSLDFNESRLTVVDDEEGDFLGSDVVFTSNVDEAAGEMGIGVTRKSGAGGVDGSGIVARVKFKASGTAPEGETLRFALNEVEADDPQGSPIGLRPRKETVALESPAAKRSAAVNGNGPVGFGDTGVTIDFSGTSGSGTVTVRRFDEGPKAPINISERNKSNFRFLIEAESELSVGTGTEVRLEVDKLEGLSNPSEAVLYKRPKAGAGGFKRLETSYDASASELVAQVEGFSEFALGSNVDPLPVELASFDAQVSSENTAVLTWQTASETRNAGFEVQHRSPEDRQWKDLSFVESKASGGTSSEPKSYRYTEEQLRPGTHQFRLKQVDLDGSSTLIDPVTVRFQMEESLRLTARSPNPVSEGTVFSFAVRQETRAAVTVYNVLGERVKTLYEGATDAGESQRVRLDASGLSSGMYFLRLRAGGQARTQKLTVVR